MGNSASATTEDDERAAPLLGRTEEEETAAPASSTNPFDGDDSERAEEAEEVEGNTLTTTSTSTARHGGGSRTNTRVEEEYDIEEPLLSRDEEDEGHTAVCCEDKCPRLCCVLKYAWSCLKITATPFVFALKSRRTKVTIPLLVLSLIVFIATLSISGHVHEWNFMAGQSRRVVTSWLTKSVKFEVLNPHTTVDIDVYSISGKCPPLTGPIVPIDHQHNTTLKPGAFEYQYFFLNQGSRVEARLFQQQGQFSKVYMFQGQDKLDTLLQPTHKQDDWLDQLIAQASLSWTIKQYSPQTAAKFRSIKNDVYTLLFDNPNHERGILWADVFLDLATYDLKGYSPVCHDIAVRKDCPRLSTRAFKQCILVDASASGGFSEEVPLRIVHYRNYARIFGLTLIPIVLAVLWEFYSCAKEKVDNCRNGGEEEDAATPSRDMRDGAYEPPASRRRVAASSAPTESPPSSPPVRTKASAPPASEDFPDAIPIVSAEAVVEVDDPPVSVAAASAPSEAEDV